MNPLACGWILLLMVCALSTAARTLVPRRWPLVPNVLASLAVGLLPPAFCGYALARMGVHLLGGGS